MTGRRKRVKHVDAPGLPRFLTFSCFERRPLLLRQGVAEIVAGRIETARRQMSFRLHAWVVMPEHVHILLSPSPDRSGMAAILSAIKRPAAEEAIRR